MTTDLPPMPPGRYEVRIVEEHVMLLMFLEGAEIPCAAVKLTADQALEASALLRGAAKRVALVGLMGEPASDAAVHAAGREASELNARQFGYRCCCVEGPTRLEPRSTICSSCDKVIPHGR